MSWPLRASKNFRPSHGPTARNHSYRQERSSLFQPGGPASRLPWFPCRKPRDHSSLGLRARGSSKVGHDYSDIGEEAEVPVTCVAQQSTDGVRVMIVVHAPVSMVLS